jgi:hypothetical protein
MPPRFEHCSSSKEVQHERAKKKWKGTSSTPEGRYQAYIRLNAKMHYVGVYDLEVDAAYASDRAIAARPPRNTKGNKMPIKDKNFATEKDWLDSWQKETTIKDSKLLTVLNRYGPRSMQK